MLTLLAILAHIVWTLVMVFRGRSEGRGATWRRSGAAGEQELTYDELLRLMARYVHGGEFRRAIGAMMLALLRRLDAVRIVVFHRSKTNGDYVREFPASGAGRTEFRRFALAFDMIAYGGMRCTPEVFGKMKSLFDQVQANVRKES